MFFKNWMSYISDDAKLTQIVMPGAHNAGTYRMARIACCQDGTLYDQVMHGVRHFCIRLDTTRKGIVFTHGISKGDLFENALRDFAKAMDECPTEVFLLDMREYSPTKYGPFTVRCNVEPAQLDALMKKYIDPEKYAYCDFSHIKNVTLGDMRRAGKRYIIINSMRSYAYSMDCQTILPWNKYVYGYKTEKFLREIPKIFEREHTEGIYWFQTQETPNVGTELGMMTPRKMDALVTPHYGELMQTIADNPEYLRQANVIGGDFMVDGIKTPLIIALNLKKDLVRPECRQAFADGLGIQ